MESKARGPDRERDQRGLRGGRGEASEGHARLRKSERCPLKVAFLGIVSWDTGLTSSSRSQNGVTTETQFYFMAQSPRPCQLEGDVPQAGIQLVCTRPAGLAIKRLEDRILVEKNALPKPFCPSAPALAARTPVLHLLGHPHSSATLLNGQGLAQGEPACTVIQPGTFHSVNVRPIIT